MSRNRLHGKRAIVTGASRGMGRAYAHALAAEGASVVVNATTVELVDEVVEEIRAAGGSAVGHCRSVASFDAAEELVETCIGAFGGVDVLVNNAGVTRERMMFNMTEDEFRSSLEVDCFGTFAVSRFAVRDMRPRRWGRIINVGDISAQSGLLGGTGVAAAKGGVHAMTYTWGAELARWGITANCVIPHAYTRMHDPLYAKAIELATERGDAHVPTMEELIARAAKPEEVTALVVYLACDESAWLNGHVVSLRKQTISLWSHASEIATLHNSEGFEVADLHDSIRRAFESHVEPVGHGEPWEVS